MFTKIAALSGKTSSLLLTAGLFSALLVSPAAARAQAQPAVAPSQPAGAGSTAAPTGGTPPAVERPAAARNITPEMKKKVGKNPLIQRLSTVGGPPRFSGNAKGASRWHDEVIGRGSVPITVPTPRGLIEAYATPDGKKLWIAGAMVRDSGVILRMGDLLPLLQVVGVSDREVALGANLLQVGSGVPPSYTLGFRPGLLWKHRATLERQRQAGRVLYSLTTGQLTVLGAHVLVEGRTGALRAQLVSPQGDQVERIEQLMTPTGCRDLEEGLRSAEPEKLLPVAKKKLGVPSMTQACAARFVALAGGPGAADLLRKALRGDQIARPFDLVEALATVSPKPEKQNLEAVLQMIQRTGTVGSDAACRAAPLSWTSALLERSDLDDATRSVLTRCAWH
ncbi:MAG: hypothetical protein P1V51_06950 [Deltaproteobacteria bacterium]|nr:hypothetical protein [Deltaproteobacteria bacterium]